MTKLEAKTKEQQDYIAALVEEESCDGDVKVCEGGIDYTVDQCFGVGMSFDTMAEIVDYLRKEPVSEDMEKAAEEEASKYLPIEPGEAIGADGEIYETEDKNWPRRCGFINGFKEGANWQKEQMMTKAIEGVARPDDCELWCNLDSFNLKDGDKVKILIVKDS